LSRKGGVPLLGKEKPKRKLFSRSSLEKAFPQKAHVKKVIQEHHKKIDE
jgi:hypothetical protein